MFKARFLAAIFLLMGPLVFGQTWQTYYAPNQGITSPAFRFVHQFSNGTILAAGEQYIVRLNAQGDTISHHFYPAIPTSPHVNHSLSQDSVIPIDLWSGCPTQDGYLVLVGKARTYSPNSYATGGIAALKVNAQGDTLWTKLLQVLDSVAWPTHGQSYLIDGFDVREDANGDLLFVGGYRTLINTHFVFIKTDSNGRVLHQSNFQSNSFFSGRSIQTMGNGHYLAVAEPNTNLKHFTLLKLDAIGDTSWTKSFALQLLGTTTALAGGFPKKIRKTSDCSPPT